MKERNVSKSVIKFLPDISSDIQSSKILAVNDGNLLKTEESTHTRYDTTIRRQVSNRRKNRLSEDRRMNRLRENIRSDRLNIRQEYNDAKGISDMRFRNAETRKTFKMVKWEVSDFGIPSVSRAIGAFQRKSGLVVPKRFTFRSRVRNNVQQDSNGAEMFVGNVRYNTRNLPSLKLREISTEQNTDSKLQLPRYERHLLVPKRELKIPSEEVSIRTANSRRSRNSFRTNDFRHGNMEETTEDRKNGRGLKIPLNKRLDSGRRQSIETVVKYRQIRRDLLESGRITDRIQTRHNTRNSDVEYSGRIRNQIQTRHNTRNLDVESSERIRDRVQKRINTRDSGVENFGRIIDRMQTRISIRNSGVESSGTIRDRTQTRSNSRYSNVESSAKVRNKMQLRSNMRSSGIEFSERMQNRQRTNVMDFNRKNREVSIKTNAASGQISGKDYQIFTRRNVQNSRMESSERMPNKLRTGVLGYERNVRGISTRTAVLQILDNNNLNRKLRINDLALNRQQDRQFSRLAGNVLTKERIHFRQERKLSNENRQRKRSSSKENIPNDLLIRNRSIRNQDQATNSLKSGIIRTVDSILKPKQQNFRSDERFSIEFRSSVLTKGRINFNSERKLSDERRERIILSRNKENIPNDLQFRSKSIRNQERAMEKLGKPSRRNVNNVPERKIRISRSDERFSTQFQSNVLAKGRISFKRERKLSNENRQESIRSSNKENIPNDLQFRSRSIRNQEREMDKLGKRSRRNADNVPERKTRTPRSDERFSTQFRSEINNERSVLTVHNKRSINRDLRIRSRRIDRETNLETRWSLMRSQIPLNQRFVKVADETRSAEYKVSSIVNVRSTILKKNKRIASNQHSDGRTDRIHLNRENDRRVKTELKSYRNADSLRRNLPESRLNVGRILTSSRIRDEYKLSKLRVSYDVRKEPSVRTMAQTRNEFNTRVNEQQRKISVRIVPKHLISTQKLHFTTMNSTSNYAHDYPASKIREIVSSNKPTASSERSKKLDRSTISSKSSSPNKSFISFYEYLSEKRSSFISLILNVMLGLAVIIASSDDKNKGFIPRRLTPFVDGFLKYTTVS